MAVGLCWEKWTMTPIRKETDRYGMLTQAVATARGGIVIDNTVFTDNQCPIFPINLSSKMPLQSNRPMKGQFSLEVGGFA